MSTYDPRQLGFKGFSGWYLISLLYLIGATILAVKNDGLHATLLLLSPIFLQGTCIAILIFMYRKNATENSPSLTSIILVLLFSSLVYLLAYFCFHNKWFWESSNFYQTGSYLLILFSLIVVGIILYSVGQTIKIRNFQVQEMTTEIEPSTNHIIQTFPDCFSCKDPRNKSFCILDKHSVITMCVLLSLFLCVTFYLSFAFAFSDRYERICSGDKKVALYRPPYLIEQPTVGEGSTAKSETNEGSTSCEPCRLSLGDLGLVCGSTQDGTTARIDPILAPGSTAPGSTVSKMPPDPLGSEIPVPGATVQAKAEIKEFIIYFAENSDKLDVDPGIVQNQNPSLPIDNSIVSTCKQLQTSITNLSDCKKDENWDIYIEASNLANLVRITTYLESSLAYPKIFIDLIGHASTDGEYKRNGTLSSERAWSVQRQLLHYLKRDHPEKIPKINSSISGTGEDPKFLREDFIKRSQENKLTFREQRSVEVRIISDKTTPESEKFGCLQTRTLFGMLKDIGVCTEKQGKCLERINQNFVNDHSKNILSVMDYIYFTIYTITTTGYGDIIPITGQAKFITSLANIYELFFIVIFFNVLCSYSPRKTVTPPGAPSSNGPTGGGGSQSTGGTGSAGPAAPSAPPPPST